MRHALQGQPAPLNGWRVASAGVAAQHGAPVSANSVAALKKVGLNLSNHRSQPLTADLANEADLILVMTESHRDMIDLLFDPPPPQVHLLREFMPRDASRDIADPYGSALAEYEACRDEIVEAIPSIMAHLRQAVGLAP